jgi:hypothetical protein
MPQVNPTAGGNDCGLNKAEIIGSIDREIALNVEPSARVKLQVTT